MRTIEETTAFRRDFKREKKGQYRRDLDSVLSGVVSLLIEDAALPGGAATMDWAANGRITANAISSPICC
jgi:mRNA-degrading endonuclease YafQ of YafQ-DinJ toxin-antitoxin module